MPSVQDTQDFATPATFSPIARGKQLRDLTIDAQNLFKKRKFNPMDEFVTCFLEVKEFNKVLDGKAEDYLKELFASAMPEDIERLQSLLEASSEIRLSAKRLKFDLIKEIVQYAAPKLRSVEHTGEINTGITVVLGVKRPEGMRTVDLPKSQEMLDRPIEERIALSNMEEE